MTAQRGDHTCKHIFTVITSDRLLAKSSQRANKTHLGSKITVSELGYIRSPQTKLCVGCTRWVPQCRAGTISQIIIYHQLIWWTTYCFSPFSSRKRQTFAGSSFLTVRIYSLSLFFFFFFTPKQTKHFLMCLVKIIGKLNDNENNPQWQSNISELQDISDPKWFSKKVRARPS